MRRSATFEDIGFFCISCKAQKGSIHRVDIEVSIHTDRGGSVCRSTEWRRSICTPCWEHTFRPLLHERLTAAVMDEDRMDVILDRAAVYFKVPRKDITSRKRDRATSDSRAVTMIIMERLLRMGPTAIGGAFRRNHASVLEAIRKVGRTPALRKAANVIAADVQIACPELAGEELGL